MALLNFDSTNVAPAEAPEAIPAGWYTAHMTASEMKPTKDNGGAYLECEYTILAPAEYAGRKQYDRINLQNANPVAVEIGYKQLSAICHATGVIQVQDSSQLHGRPLAIKVAQRPPGVGADGVQRDATNEIKGYKAATGNVQQAPQQQFAPPPPQMPAQQFQQGVVPQVGQQWTPPAAGGFTQPQQPQQGMIAPQGQPWAGAGAGHAQQPVQQQQPLPPGAGYSAPNDAAQQQQPAPMPPWAGQPQPQPQPAQQAPVQQQQAPVAGATPPWAQPQPA